LLLAGSVACGAPPGSSPASAPDVQATIAAAVQATTQAVPTQGRAAPAAPATPTPAVTTLTNENWGLALADANKHKGASVRLVGRIFLEPQSDGDVTAFQMYTNAAANDGNTLVAVRNGPRLSNFRLNFQPYEWTMPAN
jgi:hypothetical protein